MKFDFSEITVDKKELEIDDQSWFPEGEYNLSKGPVAGIAIKRTGQDEVRVEGTLNCDIVFPCDLCGTQFVTGIHSEFYYVVKNSTDDSLIIVEKEISEEDAETIYLHEPVLDIDAILLEQFYLSVPERRICKDDCKGMCLKCGETLGDAGCNCTPGVVNSPFAVLEKLKK